MNNVTELIRDISSKYPNKDAIIAPDKAHGYKKYTFSELERLINKLCNHLQGLGVRPGDKVLILLKPDIHFCAIAFALFRLGAIAVFIDPGMPKKMLFKCIKDLKPDVLLALPIIHFLTFFIRKPFSNIRLFLTNSKSNGLFRAKSIFKDLNTQEDDFDCYKPSSDDLAAILFTSGGTGPAKGVEYGHDIFINQTKMLQKEFGLTPKDIDIPGFPLFSFFTLSMGMTSVIPDMDFAKPADCDPEKILKNINDYKATFLAGSPAIWNKVASYCVANNIELPSVKYAVMFGAPVSFKIHEAFQKILPHGDSYTPYGATECLPISNISGSDVLNLYKKDSVQGAGMCVGHILDGVEIKIIKITSEAIKEFSDCQFLAVGEIGEIIVTSQNVTKKYHNLSKATSQSKIKEGDKIWHRMGDVGYLKDGKLWFCGRVKHVFEFDNKMFYPVCYELIYDEISGVERTAFVPGKKGPALFIKTKKRDEEQLVNSLKSIENDFIGNNLINEFYIRSDFPVDIRHNIKIDRIKLANELRGKL